ncbi:CopG family antitoxin [Massilia sp. YIM B04103]|uniref:CopG family antitoxin n=1 Tax=Massilia sp. YIM B04103 TaxID=2963106 RepID=UPI00210B3412|nr:CopG family antitoxin [Massilia sp. YIM B04103]
MDNPKIPGSAHSWESGQLGRDLQHAVPSTPELRAQIDNALDMQLVSLRLPNELVEKLLQIAHMRGMNYQPLIRHVLTEFADTTLDIQAKG